MSFLFLISCFLSFLDASVSRDKEKQTFIQKNNTIESKMFSSILQQYIKNNRNTYKLTVHSMYFMHYCTSFMIYMYIQVHIHVCYTCTVGMQTSLLIELLNSHVMTYTSTTLLNYRSDLFSINMLLSHITRKKDPNKHDEIIMMQSIT